jgi:hypothetical protein
VWRGVAGRRFDAAQGRSAATRCALHRRTRGAGRASYQTNCASCHLPDLAGRNEAPQLAGANFINAWRTRTTRDLFEYIQSAMPPSGENLGAEQYLAITAFILQANGAQAGTQPFTPTTTVPIGSVATGATTTGRDAAARRHGDNSHAGRPRWLARRAAGGRGRLRRRDGAARPSTCSASPSPAR